MQLFMSIFLSPTPLGGNRYSISKVKDPFSDYFRVGRFLSSLVTARDLKLSERRIYLGLDETWGNLRKSLEEKIREILPGTLIFDHRLTTAQMWGAAVSDIPHDEPVLLNCNDDHAIVPGGALALHEMSAAIESSAEIMLGAITHFPEFVTKACAVGGKNSWMGFPVVETGHAIGTTLVKGSFLQSWWVEGNFGENELVVRPDNPFGKSVTFSPVSMITPKREIMRHMDGYAHIATQRPLAPLRNLVSFELGKNFSAEKLDARYASGLWPSRIRGLSGSGSDVHEVDWVESDSGVRNLRRQIARVQAELSFRICPGAPVFHPDRKKSFSNSLLASVGTVVSLFTLPVVRNIPDFLFRLGTIGLKRLFGRLGLAIPGDIFGTSQLAYLGPFRFTYKRAEEIASDLARKPSVAAITVARGR